MGRVHEAIRIIGVGGRACGCRGFRARIGIRRAAGEPGRGLPGRVASCHGWRARGIHGQQQGGAAGYGMRRVPRRGERADSGDRGALPPLRAHALRRKRPVREQGGLHRRDEGHGHRQLERGHGQRIHQLLHHRAVGPAGGRHPVLGRGGALSHLRSRGAGKREKSGAGGDPRLPRRSRNGGA